MSRDDPDMSAKAVAKRIAPVAQLAIDPNAAAAPAHARAARLRPRRTRACRRPCARRSREDRRCGRRGQVHLRFRVHRVPWRGGRRRAEVGDKAAWAPRIATGKPALYKSALKGKGAMPPKGGNAALSDDAVKAAVDYMLAAAK